MGGIVETIKVLLVDDHPLFRQGLRNIFESQPGYEVIGEISDGGEAEEKILSMKADVALIDINLPGENGVQITRNVTTNSDNETAVIILTAYHNEEQGLHAIQAGASAYFPKEVGAEQLLEAVREVNDGKYVINSEVMSEQQMAAWLLKEIEDAALLGSFDENLFSPLSPREMEILTHVTRGYSNKEVAYALDISRQTVKNHMTSILRKLQVGDRTQAAVYALRHGWIRLKDTKYTPPQE